MHDTNLLKSLFGLLMEGKLDGAKFYQMLSRAIVQEMGSGRASVWFYNSDLQDKLVCESLYDAGDSHWSGGEVVSEDDLPDYFAALRDMRQIVATHAREHPATSSFNESYLEPLNIYSVLCVAIELGGRQIGVVSCEQCVQPREWTQPDLQYMQQVAAMIGLAAKKLGA